MKVVRLLIAFLALMALTSAFAGPVIYSRPPVMANLQTWSPPDYTQYILGDDFQFAQNTTVTALTVWIAGSSITVTDPSQEYSAISLYLGADPGPLAKISSTYSYALAGIWANPNTQTDQPIFSIRFDNLLYNAGAGVLTDFAIEGVPAGQVQLALTSTPCANLGGPCTGDGADAVFLAFTGAAGTGPYNLSFTNPGSVDDPGVADINVQLEGVPEPSTFALLGLGLGAVLALRRKK